MTDEATTITASIDPDALDKTSRFFVAAGMLLRHQDGDVPSDQLLTAIAEDALDRRVYGLDGALLVDGDDGIDGAFQHRAHSDGIVLCAMTFALDLGDVPATALDQQADRPVALRRVVSLIMASHTAFAHRGGMSVG